MSPRFLVAALLAFPHLALSQPGAPKGATPAAERDKCPLFMSRLVDLQKVAAEITAPGIGDDSVYREQVRQLKLMNNNLERLQVLQQMQAWGCKLPSIPMYGDLPYLQNAMECQLKRLGGTAEERLAACDKEKWSTTIPLIPQK
jgi:hypothetical protein